MTEVAVVKFACPLETTNVAVAELLFSMRRWQLLSCLLTRRSGKCLFHR
jgi:hypothetical protein